MPKITIIGLRVVGLASVILQFYAVSDPVRTKSPSVEFRSLVFKQCGYFPTASVSFSEKEDRCRSCLDLGCLPELISAVDCR